MIGIRQNTCLVNTSNVLLSPLPIAWKNVGKDKENIAPKKLEPIIGNATRANEVTSLLFVKISRISLSLL